MTKLVQCSQKFDGAVYEIKLFSPPANILSSAAMSEIGAEIEKTSANPALKAIVFSSEGAHFSYGASVEEHLPGKVDSMLPQFHRFVDRILTLPTPSFARVSGLCLGGAFEMVMATNFIFCDESARFGVPEIQLGVFPPVACALLPILLPGTVASKMILTGHRASAEEMKTYGFVTHLSKTGSLDTDLDSFIEKQILPKSAESLRRANQALREGIKRQYRDLIGVLEKQYLSELMRTHDAVEGITAFVDKRNPQWKNC